MNEEENGFDLKSLAILLLFYPPIALIDVIWFIIDGTSWGYDLFRLIYNPPLQFVVSLVGIVIEIYLGYYIVKHKKYHWFNWFKNEPKTPKSKTKSVHNINIFISYATEDLNRFNVLKIVAFLESKSNMQVYYWERDCGSYQSIIQYMEEKVKISDVILAISSEYSMNSEPVQKEIDMAVYQNKRIIPIFKNIKYVREILQPIRGIELRDGSFKTDLNDLYLLISKY